MNDKILNPVQIDTTSPCWKDGYKQGKKEEGLASLKHEKEAWKRGWNQAVEEAVKEMPLNLSGEINPNYALGNNDYRTKAVGLLNSLLKK